MTETLTCATPDCGRARKTGSEFCVSCDYEAGRGAELLIRETGAFLCLEAAFVEWCREHGHPNPHE